MSGQISATPVVQAMAKKTLDAMDACNPLAVVLFMSEVTAYFHRGRKNSSDSDEVCQPVTGSDAAIRNPLTLMLLEKLVSLTRLNSVDWQQPAFGQMYDATCQLASGVDVDWYQELQES